MFFFWWWGGAIRHIVTPNFVQGGFGPKNKRQKAEILHIAFNCGHLQRSQRKFEIGGH